MKKYIIPLLIFCLYIAQKAEAQKITVSFQNIPLDSALKLITKKTGMGYIIKSDCLNRARTIKLKATHASLDEILKKMCEGNPFTFYRSESIIFLAPKPIHGRVINQMGEPIPDVIVESSSRADITNSRGEFFLPLASCDNAIKFYHRRDTVIVSRPQMTYLTVHMKNNIASIVN